MALTSPELSGGAGFVFEDEVFAWWLLCMLSGTEPWRGDGRIVAVAGQQANAGWRPDDAVLTLADGQGERRCAVSIKSFAALTAKGLSGRARGPEQVPQLEQFWSLYLGQQPVRPPFHPQRDLIALVAKGIGIGPMGDWETLSGRVQSADLAAVRTTGINQKQRALFDGFACPSKLDEATGSDETATAKFLRQVRIADYHRAAPLLQVLAEQVVELPDDAQALLDALHTLASEWRPQGIAVTVLMLRARLRGRGLRLKTDPYHAADWARLRRVTQGLLADIPADLAGHSLPRCDELAAIDARFGQPGVRVVAVVGESGCGKTVVAKRWLEQRREKHDLWWDNATLDAAGDTAFRNGLDLRYPLGELLAAVPARQPCLVLDNADRLFGDTVWDNVRRLLQALALASAESAWRLLVTCEAEAWPEVTERLAAVSLPVDTIGLVTVESPEIAGLQEVLEDHAGLRPLFTRPHLSAYLRRPKVLAVALAHYREGDDTASVTSESSLITWLWRKDVERDAPRRSLAAQNLGAQQADGPSPRVAVHQLASDCQALDELRKDGICRYRDGDYAFSHDLYGDWARVQYLRKHRGFAVDGEDRALLPPLWQRALRLYGVFLLEQEGPVAWRQVFEAGAGCGDRQMAEGRLLESLALASTAETCLTEVWPCLTTNRGQRLRRFLSLLEAVGTQLLPEFGGVRLPIGYLWKPVLAALLQHRDDLRRLAPGEFAHVASSWLLIGAEVLPHAREVAEVSLDLAERVAATEADASWEQRRHGHELTEIYRAALRSAPWFPDRVAQFALGCAQRLGEPERKPFIEPMTHRELAAPAPWPDGPLRPVDETFRDLCLDDLELAGLMRVRPAVAREVLLALVISRPEPRSMFDYHPWAQDRGGLEHHRWPTHFADRGPFWVLLRSCPEEGLQTVLRLVNHTTVRWAETADAPLPPLGVEPWGEWLGDQQPFSWYRDPATAPDSVAIALMALEKWLYDLAEAEGVASLEPWISIIIAGSRSVAFAGLLAAVAVRHPELLRGALRPLITKREFVEWDLQRALLHPVVPVAHLTEAQFEAFWGWHKLDHRDRSLLRVVVTGGMLFEPHEQAFFGHVRQRWFEQAEAQIGTEAALADGLRHQLDPANYRVTKLDDGRYELSYVPPPVVAEHNRKWAKATEFTGLYFALVGRSRELLDAGRADWWEEHIDPWAQPETLSAPFTDDEARELWATSMRLVEVVTRLQADEFDPGLEPADALCGAAAALLLRGGLRPEAAPERTEWCMSTLTSTPLRLDLGGNVMGFAPASWARFCAAALPQILVARPAQSGARRAVALLATSPDFCAVQALMRAAGTRRQDLGADFGRLRHLTLAHAAARRIAQQAAGEWQRRLDWAELPVLLHERFGHTRRWWRRCRLRLAIMFGQNRNTDFQRSREASVAAFEAGVLDPLPPALSELASWRDRPETSSNERGVDCETLDPGLDLWAVRAAMAWLPPPDAADDTPERAQMLGQWRQIAELQARRLNGGDPPLSPPPMSWDDWVCFALAQVVARLSPDDPAEQLWQPVLRCGSSAHFWVGTFIGAVIQAGLQQPTRKAQLVRQWQAMIDFALSERLCDGWRPDVRQALLGCDRASLVRWSAEHADVLLEVRPHLARWAPVGLADSSSWRAMVRLLEQPAAGGIRQDGVQWLADAWSRSPFALDEGDRGHLAQLLELTRATSHADEQTHAAFSILVAALGDDPRATRFR